jgi:phage tail tape-measure protein
VEALGKLALGKAAGWLGGAAAGAGGGALVGSVVPGLGTTVGAAVGGVVGGLGTWIATDYVLLGLEEALSRERFEAEILTAIDEAEAEFLASLATP